MKDEVIITDNSNLLFKSGQPKDLTDACTEFTGNPPLEFSILFKIVTCQENKVPEPLDLDRSTLSGTFILFMVAKTAIFQSPLDLDRSTSISYIYCSFWIIGNDHPNQELQEEPLCRTTKKYRPCN